MTVEQLIAKTKMALAETEAQMKKAEEVAGFTPESIPGAEHDKPVDPASLKSDPQVADGSMGPASAYNEGGREQKNEPTEQIFEAGQPAVNPEKKPMVTSDAEAKTASAADALGNALLEDIRRIQQSKQAEAAKAEPAAPATPAKPEKKAEISDAKEEIKVTDKPEVSADANAKAENEDKGPKETVTPETNVTDTPPEKDKDVNGGAKEASDEMQFTTELLAKLACYMLAEEEGAELADRVISKVAGAEAAKDTFEFLTKQAEEAEAYEAFLKGAQDAEGFIQGQADAEAAVGADAADGVSPQEFIAALDQMVQAGEITEEQAVEAVEAAGLSGAEGESQVDEQVDELANRIAQAVEAKAITMDEAEALIQNLSGDADPEVIKALMESVGQEAPAAAPAEPAPAEPPAAPAEPPAEPPVAPAAPEAPVDENKEAAAKPEAKKAEAPKVDLLDVCRRIKEAAAKKA